jgi:hypothetical protein
MSEEIKEELKKILGDDAFSIGEMQVSERVKKLVKSVNYLVTQLKITGQWSDDEECKEHIKQVIVNVKEMLS